MKKVIIVIVILIIIVIAVVNNIVKNGEIKFELVKVVKGTVIQQVSETGQVEKGEKINLNFKNNGQIEGIYVQVGEVVRRGDLLAKLDTSDLLIQIEEANAALDIAQAKLDGLLAGATEEEIKAEQTKVKNKEIALETAKKSLIDANDDYSNTLDLAYLKAYNAKNVVTSIERSYFTGNDQESLKVKEKRVVIEAAIVGIDKNKLIEISNALKIIREICEEPNYRNIVSSADKTSLDTQRTNINTVIADLTDSQQDIVSAQSSIETAEGNLQSAKDDLALIVAGPSPEDISLYQAQVNQANSQKKLLENTINDAYLRSPVNGQIVQVDKRVGELSLQDSVLTLLPAIPFDIKVDIYEEDIVKVKIGNKVEIALVAFPDQVFEGEVISINPSEKLIDGVVYYEVIIAFKEVLQEIKPGMTADITIKTAEKENVLVVPEDAISDKDGKIIVEVFENNIVKEREIEIGLEGNNELIEVISGVEEGEEVILR